MKNSNTANKTNSPPTITKPRTLSFNNVPIKKASDTAKKVMPIKVNPPINIVLKTMLMETETCLKILSL